MKIFNKWRYGKYINSEMLVEWLEGQKYGYIKNKRDFVTYGSLEDDFDYDENEKQWELSRNRMIEKTINAIKLGETYMNED